MRLLSGKDLQQQQQQRQQNTSEHELNNNSNGIQSCCEKQKRYVRTAITTTRPSHFTDVQLNKLEGVFSKRQKPDEIQLQILAMECSIAYMDIKEWFIARRIQWIEDYMKRNPVEFWIGKNKYVRIKSSLQTQI